MFLPNRFYLSALFSMLAAGISIPAQASFLEPINFSSAGEVTLTLDESVGGFDHILELSSVIGDIGLPNIALTDVSDPSASVLGYAPANIGETFSLGSFAAGEELIFRLTNVESARLGTPGTLGDQVFTGSSGSLNPDPAAYYVYWTNPDPNTIKVYLEDLFPISASSPDPVNEFLTGGGYDVAFTLTLSPVTVPLPAPVWLFGSALIGLIGIGRRK